MLGLQIPAYVSERDIDLLLLEELHVSANFRSWFVAQVFGTGNQCAEFVGAWHSVDQANLGESDLIIEFVDSSGKMTAILVEDKIDAMPQPDQAARYQLRGQEGISDGSWQSFRTCIVAPQSYLTGTADAARYDSSVSYESIRDWFLGANPLDQRMAYKARFVQEGIEQNRRGYQRIPHPVVTQFWADYWQIACSEYPQLKMDHPGPKPARSDWALFKTSSNLWVKHKLGKGAVELEIPATHGECEQIAAWNQHLLVDSLEIAAVGKSSAITLRTPPVDKFADMSLQVDAVRTGLAAVSRLMELSARVDLDGTRK